MWSPGFVVATTAGKLAAWHRRFMTWFCRWFFFLQSLEPCGWRWASWGRTVCSRDFAGNGTGGRMCRVAMHDVENKLFIQMIQGWTNGYVEEQMKQVLSIGCLWSVAHQTFKKWTRLAVYFHLQSVACCLLNMGHSSGHGNICFGPAFEVRRESDDIGSVDSVAEWGEACSVKDWPEKLPIVAQMWNYICYHVLISWNWSKPLTE